MRVHRYFLHIKVNQEYLYRREREQVKVQFLYLWEKEAYLYLELKWDCFFSMKEG